MVDADAWAHETLERIHRHRRHEVSGMLALLDDDLMDCMDLLAVAPLLANDAAFRSDDYEARRLAWLERYQVDWEKAAEDSE